MSGQDVPNLDLKQVEEDKLPMPQEESSQNPLSGSSSKRASLSVSPKKQQKPKKKIKYHYIVDKISSSEANNPHNPMKLGDAEGYRQELELMKNAHKVALTHIDAIERRGRNADVKAEDRMYDFINYNTVKEMIEGYMNPVIKQFPQFKKDLQSMENQLKYNNGQMKNVNGELASFREQLKDHATLQTQICSCKSQLQVLEMFVDEIRMSTKQSFIDTKNEIRDFQAVNDIQNSQINNMKEELNQNLKTMEGHHFDLEQKFDGWMNDQAKEVKKIMSKVNDLTCDQKIAKARATEFNESIQAALDATIDEIYERTKQDEDRLDSFDQRIIQCEGLKGLLQAVRSNVDLLQKQATDNMYQPKFLIETMPVLLHLTVCEALDKVVGEDYKSRLLDFENNKLQEINSYYKNKAGSKNIQLMHNRLGALLKFYSVYNKGVLPFRYGTDVYETMGIDEATQVDLEKKQEVFARYNQLQEDEKRYKDCYTQLMKDRENQSEGVLEYALKPLPLTQIVRLRNQIMFNRVKVKKNYDDLVIEPPKPVINQIVERERSVEEIQVCHTPPVVMQPVEMPEHFFLFERESLRPYKRLDKKYESLFATAYRDFRRFKQQEISNFSRMTEMNMQLGQDVEVVKQVVSNIQSMFEENEALVSAKLTNLQNQADDSTAKCDKYGKQIHRMQEQTNKTADQAEMAEDRADKSARLIEALEEKIEEVLQAMEEQRQQIEEDNTKLRSELDGQKKELEVMHRMSNTQKSQYQKRSSRSRRTSPVGEADPPHNETIALSGRQGEKSQKQETEGDEIGIRDEEDSDRHHKTFDNVRETDQTLGRYDLGHRDSQGQLDAQGKKEDSGSVSRTHSQLMQKPEEPRNKPPADQYASQQRRKVSPHLQKAVVAQKPKQTKSASKKDGPGKRKAEGKAAKFEEIKRKQDIVEQRRKEREEQVERDRIEQEKVLEEKRKKHEEEERIRLAQEAQNEMVAQRKEMLRIMQKESKTRALTKSFLTELGDMRVQTATADDKIQAKLGQGALDTPAIKQVKARREDTSEEGTKSRGERQQRAKRNLARTTTKGMMSQTAVAPKARTKSQVPALKRQTAVQAYKKDELENCDTNSFGSDDSDLSARYANPFRQLFEGSGNPQGKNAIDEEKLNKILRPKFDEIYDRLSNQEDLFKQKFMQFDAGIERKLKGQTEAYMEFLKSQEKDTSKMFDEIHQTHEELHQAEKFLNENIEAIQKQMDSERIKNFKTRQSMSHEIQNEVQKIRNHDEDTKKEFKRVNSLLEALVKLTKTLLEDSMLMQMMQEQDIIDRKQISLLGIKKNSQILGNNQYAMSNALLSPEKLASLEAGAGDLATIVEGQAKNPQVWNLKNKQARYNEVVKRPDKSGFNIRGSDSRQSQRNQQQLNELSNAVHNQLNALSGTSRDPFSPQAAQYATIQPQAQGQGTGNMKIDDMIPEIKAKESASPAASKPTTPTTQVSQPQPAPTNIEINDSSLPLASRIKASEENPYNTLYIDRNCASCMSGFAPQVLHQIKLACLSYVNSPIQYQMTYAGHYKTRDPTSSNQVALSFTEVTYLKEYLLLRCQGIVEVMDAILMRESQFGSLLQTKSNEIRVDLPGCGSGLDIPKLPEAANLFQNKSLSGPEALDVPGEMNLEVAFNLPQELSRGIDTKGMPNDQMFYRRQSDADASAHPDSPMNMKNRFEDDMENKSPPKLGDESVWNNTFLNETQGAGANMKFGSNYLNEKSKQTLSIGVANSNKAKESVLVSQTNLSGSKKLLELSEGNLHEVQHGAPSPNFRTIQISSKERDDGCTRLKSDATQFSFVQHKPARAPRPEVDLSQLQKDIISTHQGPKFDIPILKDMINAKRGNMKTMTVQKYMENLYLDQVEIEEQRLQLSRSIKDRTQQLRLSMAQEREFRRLGSVVEDSREIREQRQLHEWNNDLRRLQSSLNSQGPSQYMYGKLLNSRELSSSVVVKPTAFSSMLKNDKQIMTKRQKLQTGQAARRPESVTENYSIDREVLKIQSFNQERIRQKQNRTVLSIRDQKLIKGGERSKLRQSSGLGAIDTDGTPNSHTAAENFTDLSITNSVWPRTTKNTRYQSINHDPNPVFSLGALNDGHPKKQEERTQHSSTFYVTPADLQHVIGSGLGMSSEGVKSRSAMGEQQKSKKLSVVLKQKS